MMITLLALIGYVAVATVVAVPATRALADHGHCHAEGGYTWSRRSDCLRYCNRNCWRVDDPSLLEAVYGFGLGLLWLGLLLPWVVMRIARRRVHPRLLTSEQLAQLEREAGIQ